MKLSTFCSVAVAVWTTQVAAQKASLDPFEQWFKPEPGHGTMPCFMLQLMRES